MNPKDPYGVPTGYVPRVPPVTRRMTATEARQGWEGAVTSFSAVPDPVAKAVAKAVDDYLLMERKARAWDKLRAQLFPSESRVLALMDALVEQHHG